MSPKLFSIYMHDIFAELRTCNKGCLIGQVDTSTLLYADDTVLVYETMSELQKAVNKLVECCNKLEVEINIKKTKVISTNKWSTAETIKINEEKLEEVEKFKYLGWWMEKNLSGKEHLKARKLAATVTSYQLKKIGFETEHMSPDMKVLLRDTYCRSKMKYALENTHLSEKEYAELNSVESRTLKTAFGLSRYHSNTLLNNALGITPISEITKIRKLNFAIELLNYSITREIVVNYLSNIKKIPHKSLVKEVLRLIGYKEESIEIEQFKSLIHKKVAELEKISKLDKEGDTAKAIKFLLYRKTQASKNIIKRLLHWENNTARKTRVANRKKAKQNSKI